MPQKESKEAFAARMAALEAKMLRYHNNPWILNQKAFQVTDQIWYVGTKYVASYLIDTGKGLILIDTCCLENAAQVIHNIHMTGHNPEDIAHIFLSHAHFDHCGATRYLQEFAGGKAQIWLGKDDVFFLTERRDLIHNPEWVPEFSVDHTYDYDTPFTMGEVTFRFVHSPGHTPGCTSFYIDCTLNGKPVTAAMHGGLGINGLTYEELDEAGLPRELHQAFYDQFLVNKELHVDVPLASHNHDYDLIGLAEKDDGSHEIFVNPEGWAKLMQEKLERYLAIY